VARIWADCDVIHVADSRVKTVRCHLSVTDLAELVAHWAVPAGPSSLPPIQGCAAEVGASARRSAGQNDD
jgi:hypothetical protein